MEGLFFPVLSVSLTTSLVLLPLLLAAGRLNRRYAAGTLSALWLVLALRLLVPLSPALPQAAVTLEVPAETVVIAPPSGTADAPGTSGDGEDRPAEPAFPIAEAAAVLTAAAPWIWLLGCGAVLAWQVISYAAMRRELLRRARPPRPETAARLEAAAALTGCRRRPRLVQVWGLSSPMLLGVFRPVLLLPAQPMEGEALDLVLRHELTHLRRRDGVRKLVFLLAAALHWFNPLVWWLAREAGRSLELCCDNEVVRGRGAAFRRRYGALLIQTAADSPSPVLSARFGGGKNHLKGRLDNLFGTKRNSAAAVCAVLIITLMAGTLVSCGSQTGAAPERQAEAEPLNVEAPPDASGALDALENSIVVVGDTLAFTIPQGYQGEGTWSIQVAGRAELPDFGGMSLHYLDGTAWTAGETYTADLSGEAEYLTELTLNAALGGEERTVDLLPLFAGGEAAPVQTSEPASAEPEQVSAGGWVWPLPGYEAITMPFGTRVHPITGAETSHDGLDIAAPQGTEVLAAAAGTVSAAGFDAEDGNYVEIDHGDGIATRYCCLLEQAVAEGDTVAGGAAIGTVGATGTATGPHLHLELLQDGEPVDPQPSLLGTAGQTE